MDKIKKDPPTAPRYIEAGLAAGQEYITKIVESIPLQKQNRTPNLNVSWCRKFLVLNNLIVTNTDKNLGVAVFKRDWIIDQTPTILEDKDTYTAIMLQEVANHFTRIVQEVELLCKEHLADNKQLSKFMSHCLPKSVEKWEDIVTHIPEMYSIPKIHKTLGKGDLYVQVTAYLRILRLKYLVK